MFRVVKENPVTGAIEKENDFNFESMAALAVRALDKRGIVAWIINLETGEIL
jgi:hypothetical protein